MIEDVDILVVGGGVIGSVLVRALQSLPLKVLLVDEKPIRIASSVFDARSIALSKSSIQLLKMLDIWPHLQGKDMPIERIHISERGRLGHARLVNQEGAPLGAVIEMAHLNTACAAVLDSTSLLAPAQLIKYDQDTQCATIKTSTQERIIRAQIVVGADGSESFLRHCCHLPLETKNYHQQALVANIGLKRGHQNWAYERFTEHGPLAMLPMSEQRAALIWVNNQARTQALYHLSEEAFLKALQHAFGYRLGRLIKVGQRSIYPLYQKIMPTKVIGPVVFIGNAAHTLHPIAGQGINLGLRDVAMLAQCIAERGLNADALIHYQQARVQDEQVITTFTDSLIGLFGSKIPGLSMARGLGLMALDNSDFLKRVVSRYASGYGGIVPDLVCGMSIPFTDEF